MSLVLNVEILGEFKKLTAATQGATKQLSGLQGTTQKISAGMGKAFAAIGAGLSFGLIARELKEAAKAAVEDTKSQGLLANQLRNTTGATDEQIASVEKQISKLQLTASIADDQLRPAFATLVRSTGSTTKAMDLLNLAADVSAGSGKSLTSVTMALSRAYQGKMTALTRLGIPMSDSIQNAADYAKAMTKLNQLQTDAAYLTGPAQAEALAKVAEQQDLVNRIAEAGIDWQADLAAAFEGSAVKAANLDPYQRMAIIFGEISEQVGSILLPVIQQFADWLVDVLPKVQKFFQELNDPTTEMGEKWQGMINIMDLTGKKFDELMDIFSGGKSETNMVMDWITTLTAGLGQILFYLGKLGQAWNAFWAGDFAEVARISQNYLKDYAAFIRAQNQALLPSQEVVLPGQSPFGGRAREGGIVINVNSPNMTANDIVNALNRARRADGSQRLP